MLRNQLILMFHKNGFQISFTIMMLIACGLPTYYAISNLVIGNDISHIVSSQYAYMFNACSPIANYIIYLIPVIAMLPFSISYMTDHKINCVPQIASRGGKSKYFSSKALCSAIGGFLVGVIPPVINIIINQLFLPMSNKNADGGSLAYLLSQCYNPAMFFIEVNPDFPMLNLFMNYPQIYNLLMVLLLGFFCSVCALFSYAVSLYMKKHSYLCALPMMTVLILGNKHREICESGIIPMSKFINLTLTDYVMPESQQGKSYPMFFTVCGIIIVISIFMINRKAKVTI